MSEGTVLDVHWRRSSYSGSTGGQCVEVAACGDGQVRIRHSKNPDGPQMVVPAGHWRQFLADLPAGSATESAGLVATPGQDGVLLWDSHGLSGSSLRFTPTEWEMFQRGAADGEFDITSEDELARNRPG